MSQETKGEGKGWPSWVGESCCLLVDWGYFFWSGVQSEKRRGGVKERPLSAKHPGVAEIRRQDFEDNPAYLKCVFSSVLL